MLARHILLVALGLLSAVDAILAQFGKPNYCYVDTLMGYKKETKRAFDQIDVYLTKKVSTDDAERNMEVVRKWIYQLETNSNLEGKGRLLAALMQIEALSDKTTEKCAAVSRTGIVGCFRMAGVCLDQKTLEKKNFRPTRRIEKIILQYARKLADECHFKHVIDYRNIYIFMADGTKERVRGFIGDMIINRLANQPQFMKRIGLSKVMRAFEQRPVEVSRFTWKTNKGDAKTAIESLEKFASNDDRAKFLRKNSSLSRRKPTELDEKNFRYLVYEYLYSPCLDFTTKLRNAFERDSEIDSFYEASSTELDELQRKYYRDLALYKGCLNFMENSELVVKEALRLKKKEIG